MKIYKYPLSEPIAAPEPFRIIHVGADPSGVPCLWAEVDEKKEPWPRTVRVVGTGWDAPDGLEHVGSVVHDGVVWHVYAEPSFLPTTSTRSITGA